MTIEQLKYLSEVARQRSISRTAEICFVSQPYLSSMIGRIERELGYTIFIRTKTATVLTKEGEAFMLSANRILKDYEMILNVPETLGSCRGGVSAVSIFSKDLMQLFMRFQKRYPMRGQRDFYYEHPMNEIYGLISAGDCDMGFVAFPQKSYGKYLNYFRQNKMELKIVGEDFPIVAILSENNPLFHRKTVTIQELRQFQFVYYTNWRESVILEPLGLKASKDIFVVSDRGSYIDAIETGAYISATIGLQKKEMKGSFHMPVVEGFEEYMMLGCIHLERLSLNERERLFLDFLKREIRK